MSQSEIERTLRVPPTMNFIRARPDAKVPVPAGLTETPFIHPEDPARSQIQQIWTAKVRVFDMSKSEDVTAYEQVWQLICDAGAQLSETRTDYNPKSEAYTVFCRWSEFSYKLPKDVTPNLPPAENRDMSLAMPVAPVAPVGDRDLPVTA